MVSGNRREFLVSILLFYFVVLTSLVTETKKGENLQESALEDPYTQSDKKREGNANIREKRKFDNIIEESITRRKKWKDRASGMCGNMSDVSEIINRKPCRMKPRKSICRHRHCT
jgi:hypothetical protein